MKDECLGYLFKIKGAKHKTLDLSRSYILTTPKFIQSATWSKHSPLVAILVMDICYKSQIPISSSNYPL